MSKKTSRAPIPFVLDTVSTFKWPVIVRVPDASNAGSKISTRFIAEFAHVDQERRLEILSEHRAEMERLKRAEVAGDEGAQDAVDSLYNLSQRVLDEVFVGWEGIRDRDGQVVAVTPEAKHTLVTHQMVWPAIFKAYNDAVSQQDSRGN